MNGRFLEVVLWGGVTSAVLCGAACAQQAVKCHGPEETGKLVSPEKLPPPVKMTGIGNGSIAITAANDEAKEWFTQGLNLLHDFWDYEAARAFEQAVRSDPKCAMCYWGLYKVAAFDGPGLPWAKEELDTAEKLSRHASKTERLYIKAAEAEYKDELAEMHPKPGAKQKKPARGAAHIDSAETKVLRKLVALDPSDVQARIFLAESVRDGFNEKGEPRAGTAEGQRILVGILKEHPDDTSANHYWIHAVEPGNHPELAEESAKKLGALTPASGHMVHMPGHIFYRMGDYETARSSFEDSMRVDETYMRKEKVNVADDWNYVHNLMYLIADLMEAGRLTEAMAISAKLKTARGDVGSTLYRGVPRDGLSRLSVSLPILLRAGAWTNAVQELEESSPAPELKNLVELREAMLEYTRGMRALDRGEVKEAAAASDALDARVKTKPQVPAEEMPGMSAMSASKDAMTMPVYNYLDVAAMELRASVLLAQGRKTESEAMFSKAAKAEKDLGYREPPFYIRPVEETQGDALLRVRRFDEAKHAFERALQQRPNSGFALYGVAEADAGANRWSAATADYARLLKAWSNADADLPQMQAARQWMQRQAADGE